MKFNSSNSLINTPNAILAALIAFALATLAFVVPKTLAASATTSATQVAVADPSTLTLKKPATVSASFPTLRLNAFTIDFTAQKARTAFQSYDESQPAEKRWTGYAVVIDTDEKGSTVNRPDGKGVKTEPCAVTLKELLSAIDTAGKAKKPALSQGIEQALFAKCVDS